MRDAALFMLFIVIYTSLEGAQYFLRNRLQELGILFTLILFLYGSLLAALNVRQKDLTWSFRVFLSLGLTLYLLIIPAYIYSINTGASLLPSILAARRFLFILICPAIYFLYRAGLTPRSIEKVIYTCLAAIVVSYVLHYLRIDLHAVYISEGHPLSSVVSFDLWRGYR